MAGRACPPAPPAVLAIRTDSRATTLAVRGSRWTDRRSQRSLCFTCGSGFTLGRLDTTGKEEETDQNKERYLFMHGRMCPRILFIHSDETPKSLWIKSVLTPKSIQCRVSSKKTDIEFLNSPFSISDRYVNWVGKPPGTDGISAMAFLDGENNASNKSESVQQTPPLTPTRKASGSWWIWGCGGVIISLILRKLSFLNSENTIQETRK